MSYANQSLENIQGYKMIKTVYDVGLLIQQGFTDWTKHGRVKVTEWNDLLLFNYTAEAQYEGEWTPFEMMSRGLIMHGITGECIALPFTKFFNYGEGGRFPASPAAEITEKLDGSLGIMYRLNGDYRIATRGSFESDQALWATECLKKYDLHALTAKTFPSGITLLFEIIYPENRIVVDYGDRQDLVLIGATDRFRNIDYWKATWEWFGNRVGLPMPREFSLMEHPHPDQFLRMLNGERKYNPDAELIEGFVVRYGDETRFKFKTEEYKRLHYIINHLSFNRVLQEVKQGAIEQWLETIPDEFASQVKEHYQIIMETVATITARVEAAYQDAPKTTRKAYALWVREHVPDLAPYMFLRMDDRPYKDKILQHEFK
jgi:RNA ligase